MDYLASRSLGRVSLFEIPTTTTSISGEFQSAQDVIRLKDGSIASFMPQKRSYEDHFSSIETTEESLSNRSGFRFASTMHQENQDRSVPPSRLFRKGRKRLPEEEEIRSSTLFKLHQYPTLPFNGCTTVMREKSVIRLKTLLESLPRLSEYVNN